VEKFLKKKHAIELRRGLQIIFLLLIVFSMEYLFIQYYFRWFFSTHNYIYAPFVCLPFWIAGLLSDYKTTQAFYLKDKKYFETHEVNIIFLNFYKKYGFIKGFIFSILLIEITIFILPTLLLIIIDTIKIAILWITSISSILAIAHLFAAGNNTYVFFTRMSKIK
jgi:hypothetical protein